MSSSFDQPPQKSWWGRNWIWVVPVGCLTPMLLCCGGVLSIGLFVFGTLKSSDAYTEALSRATANAEVKKQLGEPITAGFWVAGNVEIRGADGKADLLIPISGPKGSAMIQSVATKTNGKWVFSKLELQPIGEGARIDLLPKTNPPPEADKLPKGDGPQTKIKAKASP